VQRHAGDPGAPGGSAERVDGQLFAVVELTVDGGLVVAVQVTAVGPLPRR
jgi:hypothetical protein